MDWSEILRETIRFLEEHLCGGDADIREAARSVHISPFYLQKCFRIVTGYTTAEYVRSRRLYLAAAELLSGNEKIIDLSYKYGYDTPESFTKAFTRFHGVTPTALKKDPSRLRRFLPLKIQFILQGGYEMETVTFEKAEGFRVIGFAREFSFGNSYEEIPKFWSELMGKYLIPAQRENSPENALLRAVKENGIGEFGVCADDDPALSENGKFLYLIAGKYRGGEVPEGMRLYEFPALEWAKFRCTGPMPGALQSLNTRVFREWLPNHSEVRIARPVNIEWYSEQGNTADADYESAIWIPVIRTEKQDS